MFQNIVKQRPGGVPGFGRNNGQAKMDYSSRNIQIAWPFGAVLQNRREIDRFEHWAKDGAG